MNGKEALGNTIRVLRDGEVKPMVGRWRLQSTCNACNTFHLSILFFYWPSERTKRDPLVEENPQCRAWFLDIFRDLIHCPSLTCFEGRKWKHYWHQLWFWPLFIDGKFWHNAQNHRSRSSRKLSQGGKYFSFTLLSLQLTMEASKRSWDSSVRKSTHWEICRKVIVLS